MSAKETHIPEKAHHILREYAAGSHYTNNLMIGTANRVEDALIEAGVVMSGSGYPAGLMTRLYSSDTVHRFSDSNFKYLRNPQAFRRDVFGHKPPIDESYRTMYSAELDFLGLKIDTLKSEDIRTIHRNRIARLVGKTPEEVGNGYIKRLLDRPEICDLLIQYFNEHQIAQFREYIADDNSFRL